MKFSNFFFFFYFVLITYHTHTPHTHTHTHHTHTHCTALHCTDNETNWIEEVFIVAKKSFPNDIDNAVEFVDIFLGCVWRYKIEWCNNVWNAAMTL